MLTVVLGCLFALATADGVPKLGNCTFDAGVKQDAVDKLKPLAGLSWTVNDATNNYNYTINICKETVGFKNHGVSQYIKATKETVKIGDLTKADLNGGTDWLWLEYDGGDKYKHSCNGTSRTAVIMIKCEAGFSKGKAVFLEENTDRAENDCHYLFEIKHSALCPKTGLSPGSVFIIIFLVALALYLGIGILYQRCVAGAQGWQQLPNYSFWQGFGSLQADGCDFVCRCGDRQGAKQYRSIDDEIVGGAEPPRMERDDSLLNM